MTPTNTRLIIAAWALVAGLFAGLATADTERVLLPCWQFNSNRPPEWDVVAPEVVEFDADGRRYPRSNHICLDLDTPTEVRAVSTFAKRAGVVQMIAWSGALTVEYIGPPERFDPNSDGVYGIEDFTLVFSAIPQTPEGNREANALYRIFSGLFGKCHDGVVVSDCRRITDTGTGE